MEIWLYKQFVKKQLTLGLISIVRNSLKAGCGVKLWSFFSSWTSHWGAKWTFFRSTHLPDLLEELIAFSAWEKPSADPAPKENTQKYALYL